MQLPLQDFTALVRVQAAAVAASARTLIDVSVGSVLRAVLEANASVGLWVQWLIMEVLSTTRAATSTAADLDSWVADFGMLRLPALAARGEVTFSRVTAGLGAVVPVGALVRTGSTADAQGFIVIADSSRASWTGAGYAIGAAAFEVTAPVQALTPGWAGNVQAGVIRLLSTAVPGVDSVVNVNAASGGLDAETDAALRVRFGSFIDSRTRATEQAVAFAIRGVQQGLQFQFMERLDAAGVPRAGHFTVVLDDGSGRPSDGLIQQVGVAIEGVRAVGSTYSVIRPQLLGADISMRVAGTVDGGAAVRAAVTAYAAGLPIGMVLTVSRLIQMAHEADPAVYRVSDVTINGVAGDLQPPLFGRVLPGVVTVLS